MNRNRAVRPLTFAVQTHLLPLWRGLLRVADAVIDTCYDRGSAFLAETAF